MFRVIAFKTGRALLTLLLAVLVVFVGVRLLPGDVAVALSGGDGDPAAQQAIREQYGLDQPIAVQFALYLGQLLVGNFGRSAATGMPVSEVILGALPVTLELAILAMVVAIVAGMALGVIAAVFRGRLIDGVASGVGLLALAVPNFWVGMMMILVLSVTLKWLPASGYVPFAEDPWGNFSRMIMPAIVVGTSFAAIIMRQTRSAMIEILNDDYIRTARAKGVSELGIVMRHGLRGSLIVVTTVVGLQLGGLISGAVITEQVFLMPGLGKLTIDAVFTRDYPLIQGVVIIVAAAYIFINLLTDVLYMVIDPRIRTGRA